MNFIDIYSPSTNGLNIISYFYQSCSQYVVLTWYHHKVAYTHSRVETWGLKTCLPRWILFSAFCVWV